MKDLENHVDDSERASGALSSKPNGVRAALTPDFIDEHLDRVMRASGSSLKHYTEYSKGKMRKAMAAALVEVMGQSNA